MARQSGTPQSPNPGQARISPAAHGNAPRARRRSAVKLVCPPREGLWTRRGHALNDIVRLFYKRNKLRIRDAVNYQIPVAFEGEDAGAGDLTWGQWDILPQMRARQTSFSIGGPLPQPDGTTVGDVADELRFLLCRYPALRTRLAFTEDGSPLQVVASAGEVPLEIVDAGTNDPLAVAAEVHRRWNAQVFDETREWPVRWAAIVRGGMVTHAVPL